MLPPGFTAHEDGKITSPGGKVLSASPDGAGYLKVTVWSAGKNTTLAVHRVVCEAFHGPRPFPEAQVRHLDGDQLNNAAGNLAWGTATENYQDAVDHGRQVRRLTAQDIQEIRRLYAAGGVTQKALAQRYGVSRPRITQVIRTP